MGIIQTILAFIITLGILVSFHEWGHFWVARRMGVKVLRFSIGFGKSLFTWRDKYNTEFSLAMIPLGGYVKMLDEREGDVPDEQKHMAFNNKSVWARIAVVAAGPIANFILAIVAIWIIYLTGIQNVIPVIGEVLPGSPAATAGLPVNGEITEVNGNKITSWGDVNLELAARIGDVEPVTLSVLSAASSNLYSLSVHNWPEDLEKESLLTTVGIVPWSPVTPAVINKTLPDSAAAISGLKAGDQVLSINEKQIENWSQMVEIIRSNPGSLLQVKIQRGENTLILPVTPKGQQLNNRTVGFLGAETQPAQWPENQIRLLSYNPFTAFTKSLSETWKLTSITFQSLGKIMTGILSVNNLSGPITIAKIASTSLHSGFKSFLYFLAMLSISLGVINLLPVPALDGGHLFFYFIEVIKGKPLPEKIQNFSLQIGVILILCVMLLALYNDFNRLI